MTIRESIVAEADRRNMTGTELARRAGLHWNTIYRYLRGDMDLRGEALDAVLTVLRIKLVRPKRRS